MAVYLSGMHNASNPKAKITRNRSMRRQAFSLVEMIVVTVVLVGLAAFIVWIILPNRMHSAYRVNCAGHQKQIGQGLLLYAYDFDGLLPMQNAPGTRDLQVLADQGYIQGFRTYGCPASPRMRHKVEELPTANNMDFVYIGSGLRDIDYGPEYLRLTFDASGNHPDNEWMNVLFLDGHTQGALPDGSKGWNTMASLATDPTGAAAKVATDMAALAAQGKAEDEPAKQDAEAEAGAAEPAPAPGQ